MKSGSHKLAQQQIWVPATNLTYDEGAVPKFIIYNRACVFALWLLWLPFVCLFISPQQMICQALMI